MSAPLLSRPRRSGPAPPVRRRPGGSDLRPHRLRRVGLATGAAVLGTGLGFLLGGGLPLLALGAAAGLLVAAGAVLVPRWDATSWGTALLLLLFLVPSKLVLVGPLKSNGSPALLVSLAMLLLWGLARTLPLPPGHDRAQPVRYGMLGLLLAALAALAAGYDRPLSALELAGATRALVALAAFAGVVLLVADCVPTVERLMTLAFRTVVLGTASSLIAVVQFYLPNFAYQTLFPTGVLTPNGDFTDDAFRAGFRRVVGTSAHPIEFGVTTAMVAVLATHFALAPLPSRRRTAARACLVVLLAVLPMALSRGAIVGVGVGFGLLALTWSWRRRVSLLLAALVGAAALRAAVPGLLGTVRSLFLNLGTDPSISGRTEDYSAVDALFTRHPWFGRGLGTFLPAQYFFLDNQYLGFLLDGGIVLLAAFVILLAVGGLTGLGLRAQPDRRLTSFGTVLVAALAVFAVTSATFDSWGFQQDRTVLALLLGMAGAAWRLTPGPTGGMTQKLDHGMSEPSRLL